MSEKSVLEIFKSELTGGTTSKLTGLAPIDKVIGAIIGVGGMGAIAVIAAAGIYKMPPLSSLSGAKGYKSLKKMLKGAKILWDMVEPLLRRWKPELKEKFYTIDQSFDFIQAFLDKEEIGSLIHSSEDYD